MAGTRCTRLYQNASEKILGQRPPIERTKKAGVIISNLSFFKIFSRFTGWTRKTR